MRVKDEAVKTGKMTMIGPALLGVGLSLFTSMAVAASGRIEVQGHRGARAARPENTLPAFEYALEVGVDTLELDLGVTKDGVLVVSHDPYVNPEICLALGGKRIEDKIPLRSLTLAEVKTYDCGTLKNPRFSEQKPVPGTSMPTLAEVFELVEASKAHATKTVQFNIETKIVPRFVGSVTPEPAEFAKLVVDLVKKHGLESRVVVQSFDHRSLVAVKEIDKKIRIAALFGETMLARAGLEAFVKEAKPEILSPNLNFVTPEYVKAAHAAGAKVIPWTANTPEEWDWLVQCGVDGIITDDPARLIDYLKAKKLR